ncbi:MAG: hypothetical protein ACOX5R_19230 [bacterium]|jgi:hypothetical protein
MDVYINRIHLTVMQALSPDDARQLSIRLSELLAQHDFAPTDTRAISIRVTAPSASGTGQLAQSIYQAICRNL